MKVKFLAAACAALGCASAFAVPAVSYDPTSFTATQTVYIAGASAQKNALQAVVPSTIFDTTVRTVLKITGANGEVAWLGDAKAAYGGGVTMVIYNSTNGSAAGLNQVISAGTPEAEATVLDNKNLTGCGTTKGSEAAGTVTVDTITCTGPNVAREADLALSDVYANEFAPFLLSSGSALKNAASSASTGIEGFGIIVNAPLYNALITKNIADGLLPASCASATASTLVVGTGNGACQPSVRSADYASFVMSGGQFNSSDAFGVAAGNITLCRRDDLSGTQAASNLFFLNNVCGLQGYKGAMAVTTSPESVAGFTVVDSDNVSTGKAETCVWSGSATGTAAMSDYGIGVVSIGEKDAVDLAPTIAKPAAYYFVKIDGVSPNYKANGTYDSLHRANLLNGAYKFATEMGAYVKSATSLTTGNGKVARAIVDDIAKANLSNLSGIAYLAGTADATKTARYTKGGNNCSVWQ